MKYIILLIIILGRPFMARGQDGSPDPDFVPNIKGLNTIAESISDLSFSVLQPDGKVIVAGMFGTVHRMDTNGVVDKSFRCGYQSMNLKGVRRFQDGRLLLFGQTFRTSHPVTSMFDGIAVFNPDGTINNSFEQVLLNQSIVEDAAILPDGKILLAGRLLVDGAGNQLQYSLLRLLPNGAIDPSFHRGVVTGQFSCIHILDNGKILAGGDLTGFDGNSTKSIIRLNSAGTLDPGFTTNFTLNKIVRIVAKPAGEFLLVTSSISIHHIHENGQVHTGFQPVVLNPNENFLPQILVLDNGRFIVSMLRGPDNIPAYIRKYLPDGNPDPEFNVRLNPVANVSSLLKLPLNRILLTGVFFEIENQNRSYLAVLSETGNLLPGYFTQMSGMPIANCLAVQPDEKILIGGGFLSVWDKKRNMLARLEPNGELDSSFQAQIPFDFKTVEKIGVQPDGKILVLRYLYSRGNTAENRFTIHQLERYLPDGSRDFSFLANHPTEQHTFQDFDIQADGKILVTGLFDSLLNRPVNRRARLNQDGTIDDSFGSNSATYFVTQQKIKVVKNGKILFTGYTEGQAGIIGDSLFRFLSNGLTDDSFTKNYFSGGHVKGIETCPDESVVLFGDFRSCGGDTTVRYCARISPNGDSVLSRFPILPFWGSYIIISDCKVQQDGKILLSGYFKLNTGQVVTIARFNPDGSVDPWFFPISNFVGGYTYGPICLQKNNTRLLNACLSRTISVDARTGLTRYYTGSILPNEFNKIKGMITRNTGENCAELPGTVPFRNSFVKAEPGPYFGIADAQGMYSIRSDTGRFIVSQVLPNDNYSGITNSQICPPDSQFHQVYFPNYSDSSSGHHFSNRVQECSYLLLKVQSNRRRRCARNLTSVLVSNSGALASSSNTKITVKFPAYVVLLNASHPYEFQPSDSTYIFLIGSVAPNSFISIQMTDSVLCLNGIMGKLQCTKAWLNVKNTCTPSPFWDGVDLMVTSKCIGSQPVFTLKNKGLAMSSPGVYQIFADSLLVGTESFLLSGNDSIVLNPQFNSPHIVRLTVPQSAHHPNPGFVSAEVNCSGIPMLPRWFSDPGEPVIEHTSCMQIRDSYDPNDKQVFPSGQTNKGLVPPGTAFHYLIRFQNTGNDTAYRVVVRDYLDEDFDLASFEPGPSSHSYTLTVSGKGKPMLDFNFERIYLVDSATNPTLSQGFISFQIQAKKGLPLGSRLFNLADICFDQNPPIRTNHTLNTLFEPELTTGILDSNSLKQNPKEEWKSVVYPNPAQNDVKILTNQKIDLQIFTTMGHQKERHSLNPGVNTVPLNHLPRGIYLLRMMNGSDQRVKKLVKEE